MKKSFYYGIIIGIISYLTLFFLLSCQSSNPTESPISNKSEATHFDSIILSNDGIELKIDPTGFYWNINSVGETSLSTYQTNNGYAGLRTSLTALDGLLEKLNQIQAKVDSLEQEIKGLKNH